MGIQFKILSDTKFQSLKNSLVTRLQEGLNDKYNSRDSWSCNIFYLIDKGYYLYEDQIVNPSIIYSLLDDGILKYKKKQEHQGLPSLKYSL